MNDPIQISDEAKAELRAQFVPEAAIEVAECILGNLIPTAATVAREYDEEAGDDRNLAGLNCSRRTKNLAARQLRRAGEGHLSEVTVVPRRGFTWDINADGTGLHIYSAPDGVGNLNLVGSPRKAELIERSNEQLKLFDESGIRSNPKDVVLLYTRDELGIVERVSLGVTRSAHELEWEVPIFVASISANRTNAEQEEDAGPTFREQPDVEPSVSLKRSTKRHENL